MTLLAASLAAVAWGALAFGAVYPWAFTPLAIACASIGLAALFIERRGRPPIGALAIGLLAIGVAIGLQLVPLPAAVLARVSPGSDGFLNQYELSYTVMHQAHPISIAPASTAVGLMLFAAFALFLLGLSRLASVAAASSIGRPLIWFGIVLALVGIAQYTLTADEVHPLIYGFWQPRFNSHPFGPFVNPNHFAGWMLMALPLALAAFYDGLLRAIHPAPRPHKDRMALLGSPQFGVLMMFVLSCFVMGLSLVMTRSRSGIAAFALGSVLAGWVVFRQQTGRVAKAVVAAAFLVLLLGTAGWAGFDAAFGKFLADRQGLSMGGRIGAWKDTLQIIRRFPLTGSGLDTYGTAMILYQTGTRALHFQEAHNDYLQLAAEGGLLVGLPVLFTAAVFVRDVRRRFREAPKKGTTYWFRVGAAIGLVSIALQSLVEFSLQMPGNAALFAVLAAIALHQSPNLRRGTQDGVA